MVPIPLRCQFAHAAMAWDDKFLDQNLVAHTPVCAVTAIEGALRIAKMELPGDGLHSHRDSEDSHGSRDLGSMTRSRRCYKLLSDVDLLHAAVAYWPS
jgi:hypothetical protein